MLYKKCKVDGQKCLFIGQQEKEVPNGFVRVIFPNGSIYEGVVNGKSRNGWGRFITAEPMPIC